MLHALLFSLDVCGELQLGPLHSCKLKSQTVSRAALMLCQIGRRGLSRPELCRAEAVVRQHNTLGSVAGVPIAPLLEY